MTLEHEDVRRGASGPASYTDLVLIANLLANAGALDQATTEAIWDLPASRKLGLDASVLADPSAEAAEREAEFRSSLAALSSADARGVVRAAPAVRVGSHGARTLLPANGSPARRLPSPGHIGFDPIRIPPTPFG